MNQLEFFQKLYQFCDGYIELRPLPNGKNRIFVDCGSGLSSIATFCESNKTSHLYFGVGTRDGKGGKAENIIHIPCVWCDCDFDKAPKHIIAANLKRFPFRPSITVMSGGGVHFYWLLKEPSKDYNTIVDINHRIRDQLDGDPNACDIARILRIPDTTNHKYPAECKIHKFNEFYYNIESFIDVLPESNKAESSNQNGTFRIKDPEWLSRAMIGVKHGERNATGTKIAGYWINKLDPDEVLTILKMWNLNNDPPLPQPDIGRIVESVSRYKIEQSKEPIENVYDTKRMLQKYREYIEKLQQNKFVTGITNIDDRIRGIAGGEVLTIVARAGSFKTALLQNLLRNYVKTSDMGAIFFSLEMPVPSITERYFEMLNELKGHEVEALYSDKNSEEICKEFETNFIDELPNFFVVPAKIGLSDITKYIKEIEINYKVKIGVIGIDYMGLMDAHGNSEYEVISNLAKGFKNTAKSIGLPVIVLSQVSRKGGEGETEITMDQGRGSGAIEEAADFMLGLWQTEKEETSAMVVREHKYDLICKIIKNRKGPRGSKWILDLDPGTFRIGSESKRYEVKTTKRQWNQNG